MRSSVMILCAFAAYLVVWFTGSMFVLFESGPWAGVAVGALGAAIGAGLITVLTKTYDDPF